MSIERCSKCDRMYDLDFEDGTITTDEEPVCPTCLEEFNFLCLNCGTALKQDQLLIRCECPECSPLCPKCQTDNLEEI